jgi:hypothetical protein
MLSNVRRLNQESTNTWPAAALSVSQNILQIRCTAVRTAAAQHEFYSLDSSNSGVAISDTAFVQLIRYRKFHLSPRHDWAFPYGAVILIITSPDRGDILLELRYFTMIARTASVFA